MSGAFESTEKGAGAIDIDACPDCGDHQPFDELNTEFLLVAVRLCVEREKAGCRQVMHGFQVLHHTNFFVFQVNIDQNF